VSRKTIVAVPSDTELDWDNENHRLILEREAFSEPPHPRPTMRTPERSRFWWVWRFFGYVVFVPARKAWAYYSRSTGPWSRRFRSSEAVRDWLWGHGSTPRWLRPVRQFLFWLFVKGWCCPHCGFTDFDEDYTIYPKTEDGEKRTVELFEHVEGGGVDYFGEAEDYHGWQWCFRCGFRSWETH
jgi:hypothetical protein